MACLARTASPDSFFELSLLYSPARITGPGQIDGHLVAIMASEPRYDGGMIDIAAGAKVMQLIQLCATFHLPIGPASTDPRQRAVRRRLLISLRP